MKNWYKMATDVRRVCDSCHRQIQGSDYSDAIGEPVTPMPNDNHGTCKDCFQHFVFQFNLLESHPEWQNMLYMCAWCKRLQDPVTKNTITSKQVKRFPKKLRYSDGICQECLPKLRQEYFDNKKSKKSITASTDKPSHHDLLPKDFDTSERGSCMLAAEYITKKLLERGILNFKVVEGYVSFDGVEWDEAHTWIEMANGEKIDPTLKQWGYPEEQARYVKVERVFTPSQYLKLCEKPSTQ